MHALYQTFITIVENETLVKAADVLHLTQPTVTRHIQQLEGQLGLPLFDRVGKRLILNRAGELVYQYAKSYVSLEQKMRDELMAFSDAETGTVYIGAGLTPSIYLLPPVLATYRGNHPGVQFQVRTGSSKWVTEAVRNREVDMGVVTTAPCDLPELSTTPLVRDTLLFVASPHHPLVRKTTIRLEDAVHYPFVLMREESGLRQWISALMEHHGIHLPVAMETDSLESISRLVQHNVGVSVLPTSAVSDDVAAGRLVVLTLADVELGARTITLVTRSQSSLTASAAQFVYALPRLVQDFSRAGGGAVE